MVPCLPATVQRKRNNGMIYHMDPQYAPQAPQNQYDFLNSPQTGPKKPFMTGGNPKQKVLLSVIFIVVVVVILIIAFAVFRSLTAKDYSAYKSLINKQTEIIRIADAGISKARDTSVKNYVSTVGAVTESEKSDTLAFAKIAGVNINEKQLAAAKDADNDKLLADAEKNNQYDQKLVELLNKLVISYQKDVKSAATAATGKKEKALVIKLQNNALVIANTPAKQN